MQLIKAILALIVSAISLAPATAHAKAHPWKAGGTVPEEEIDLKGNPDRWFAVEMLNDSVFGLMQGRSYPAECPVKRSDLRYLRLLHRNAEGQSQCGELVVNRIIAAKVLDIFRRLYITGYRIESMMLADNYADDDDSMNHNNTSGFYYRKATGSTKKISAHGRGLAIDLNPLYNPYVKAHPRGSTGDNRNDKNGKSDTEKANNRGNTDAKGAGGRRQQKCEVLPEAGREYAFGRASRTDIPYKIDRSDAAYRLFVKAGFRWGGAWHSVKDYQHFEYPASYR